MDITNTAIPTGSHEKHAEAHFSWISKAMDAMIHESRLSPIFWADAAVYACYLHNRIPCMDSGATPFTRVTNIATDWGHIRKFGASTVWKLPNDKLKKHPGIPRGQHMIFVGFSELSSGWKLFDPLTRKYVSGADDVVFYEDMSARKDSLRHFDRRRAIEKKKEKQPLIIGDNAVSESDRLSIEAIRNIYIDPEEVDPTPVDHNAINQTAQPVEGEGQVEAGGREEEEEEEGAGEATAEAIQAIRDLSLIHI